MELQFSKTNGLTSREVGGKAKGLSFLRQNELLTPDYYAIDFGTLQAALSAPEGFRKIVEEWQKAKSISEKKLWAVRSSAAAEDGESKSFAGQFKTKLNLRVDELPDALKEVVESYGNQTAYAEKSIAFGVIIQEMLNPDYSGVFFSKDPVLTYRNEAVISIIPGLGEKLVSGELPGYHLDFKDGHPNYKGSSEIIHGETFNGSGRVEITRAESDIEEAIRPHIYEMLLVAGQLEKIKGTALDFEFAIQEGILYWLQIRPITTRGLKTSCIVWDNTSVEANYPGTTLPLSVSFIRRTFFKAYSGGAKSIGFRRKVLEGNSDSLKNMCGEIEGGLFYNVTAWQTLLYQMPFGAKFSRQLPKMWGMEEAPFTIPEICHSRLDKLVIGFRLFFTLLNGSKYEKRYTNLHQKLVVSFDEKEIANDNLEELVRRFKEIETNLGDNWIAPVLNGFYTLLTFSFLKRKIARSRISKGHPNFVNDILFSEGDVISVKLVREFQQLLAVISENKEIKTLFREQKEGAILEVLERDFNPVYKQISSYIELYGNRTDQGELKMETITYKQNSERFIHYLKSNLKGYVVKEKEVTNFDYRKIIQEAYPINFLNRWLLLKLVKSTIKRVKARENYRFMRTDTFAVVRILFLQMGEVLTRKNKLDVPRDVLYLDLEELLDLKKQDTFKALIRQRKSDYVNYEKKTHINRYIASEGKLIPIADDTIELEGNELKGTACCSGVVTSKVMLIDGSTDFDQDFNDYILVANYFEPGWISLFYQAKGIISERGNLLSHTAIICRELNVPSIVGVKGIMKRIKAGEMITMDGATGIIKFGADE